MKNEKRIFTIQRKYKFTNEMVVERKVMH